MSLMSPILIMILRDDVRGIKEYIKKLNLIRKPKNINLIFNPVHDFTILNFILSK